MVKRNGGQKSKWRRSKKPRDNVWRPQEACPRESELFENYYKLQNIVPEEEFPAFIECLKTDLPTTFRINEADPSYEIIKNNLKTKYHFEGTVEYEGQQISAVHPIEWYEDEGAWQIDIHRKKLRKLEAFKELHKYMIALTLSGHIGRQEAVSMLPPMFLGVEKDDIVLDMCAAPGSKTLQMLENVHRHEGNGVIIANDADSKRAYLLVHQTSHLKSSNIIVTTHLGQQFPFLRYDEDECANVNNTRTCRGSVFDKILCDVPCSGDGTLRKAPELWKKWNVKYSLALHPLQLAITMRGLKLLKVGGRLVYSTCSLNPIEDESVILSLLRRCRGAVRIVDASTMYPKLRRTAGMYDWKVTDPNNKVYESFDAIPVTDRRLYRESMFAPRDASECASVHLERAMRFLPHHQDTGGFFVCLLEKVAEIPRAEREEEDLSAITEVTVGVKEEEEEEEEKEEEIIEEEEGVMKAEEEEGGDLVGIVKEEQRAFSANRKYEVLLPWDRSALQILKEFYGINDAFDWSLIYSRSENNHILLYVNPTISRLCLLSTSSKRLKVVNTGLKLFEYNSRTCECPYRICQEGMPILRKYMTKRVIQVPLEDFMLILTTQRQSAEVDAFTETTKMAMTEMEAGACIFELDDATKQTLSEKYPSFKHYFNEMGCVVWRGVKNINVLVTEADINTMVRVLTMDQQ